MRVSSNDPRSLHTQAASLWVASGTVDNNSEQDEAAGRAVAFGTSVGRDGPPRRSANWAQALNKYETFWRNGDPHRSARENTRNRSALPKEERNLAEWARYQRRFQERLSTFQLVRLDMSPAFEWDPIDAAWQSHLRECHEFVAATTRLPVLNSADRNEYLLARWLNRQTRQQLHGRLTSSRATALTVLIRGALDSRP